MPKVEKKNQNPVVYDLKKSFASELRGQRFLSPENLVMWLDMSSTTPKYGDFTVSQQNSPSSGTTTEFDKNYNFIDLNGTNQSVTVNDDDLLSIGGLVGAPADKPCTISFWLNVDSIDGSLDYIFAKGGPTNREYHAFLYDTGLLRFVLYDESNNDGYHASTSLNDISIGQNVWQNVTITYNPDITDSNGISIFINGQNKTNDFTRGPNYQGSENGGGSFKIGMDYNSSENLDGKIAEFSFFNKVLSEEEVLAIYYATITGIRNTKSGFISLPPRVLLKQYDSATGSYPTIVRTGDASRRGNYSVNFDDTNTVLFKNPFAKAELDFGLPSLAASSDVVPKPGDSITLTDTDGTSYQIIFQTESDVDTRIGAYSGQNGTTPDTLEGYYSVFGNNPRFIKIPNNVIDRAALATNFIQEVNKLFKIKASLKKVRKGISGVGVSFDKNVIVELVQEVPGTAGNLTISRSLTPTITQETINTNFFDPRSGRQITRVSYTGLIIPDQFTGGKDVNVNRTTNLPSGADRLQRHSYATPNILETQLDGSGSIVSGIADSHIRFTPGEDLTAFNDSRIHIGDGEFYAVGTDPNVIQGFSSPLKSKTQITVDLSPSSPTEFGYKRNLTEADPVDDTSGNGQILMVYWNNVQKKWEEVGQPVHANTVSPASVETMINMITGACIGFAPASTVLATGSDNDAYDNTLLNTAYLKSLGKPIDSFGFPFSAQYHATASQYIKARDLGILHPFILEKATVQFDAKFGIQHNTNIHGTNQDFLLSPIVSYKNITNPSQKTGDVRVRVINPNFFLLRQKRNILNVNIDFCDPRSSVNEINFNFEIPKNQIIQSGSNESIYIDKSRELIGYGQMMIIASQSATSNNPLGNHTIQDLFNAGLSRDLNVSLNDITRYTSNFTSLTGSFKMDFSVKTNARRQKVHQFRYKEQGSSHNVGRLQNQFGGRSTDDLDNANRALINGFGALTRTDSFLLPGPGAGDIPSGSFLPDENTLEKVSPYLIMPDDELVFGWQYPLHDNILNHNVGSSDTPFYTMTLFDKSQLTLYGSLVKDNKEFHDTLNQPLTSQAVHEAIHHNNTVLDQFEVEDDTQYIGTYLDDYFEGKNTVTDPQSRLGLEVSSIVESGSVSLDQASMQRNTTLFNRRRVYYDSYFPDLESLVTANGAVLYSSTSFTFDVDDQSNYLSDQGKRSQYTGTRTVPDGDKVSRSASARVFNRYIFEGSQFNYVRTLRPNGGLGSLTPQPVSFPNLTFEDVSIQYRGIPGFKSFVQSVLSVPYKHNSTRQIRSDSNFQIVAAQLHKVIMEDASGGATDGNANTVVVIASGTMPGIKILDVNQLKSLFRNRNAEDTLNYNNGIPFFNEESSQLVQASALIDSSYPNNVRVHTASLSRRDFGFLESNSLPYGMINADPLLPKYVFRGSSYGQFADFMYASPNTRFVRFRNDGRFRVSQSAVKVEFVTGSVDLGNILATGRRFRKMLPSELVESVRGFQSSNLDQFCTSSLPFYDDDTPRNRDYPTDLIIV